MLCSVTGLTVEHGLLCDKIINSTCPDSKYIKFYLHTRWVMICRVLKQHRTMTTNHGLHKLILFSFSSTQHVRFQFSFSFSLFFFRTYVVYIFVLFKPSTWPSVISQANYKYRSKNYTNTRTFPGALQTNRIKRKKTQYFGDSSATFNRHKLTENDKVIFLNFIVCFICWRVQGWCEIVLVL